MSYTVLWIDDEFDKQEAIFDHALSLGMDLIPFKTSKAGMKELESNIWKYDGVILDAKVFDETEDEVAKLTGLQNSIYRIKEFSSIRVLPYFIYTGQKDLDSNATFADLLPGVRVFKKGIDNETMFKEIKQAADKLPETQIRHNNKQLFEIFKYKYLPPPVEQQVLELFKSEIPTEKVAIKSMLANIRSIHESCVLHLEQIGVLAKPKPSKFAEVVRQLSGNKTKESNYKATSTEYQNESIENLQKWIYFTCGSYIHNLDDERYKGYMISKYAMESLRSGLLEILLWFKKTCEENPKK